MNRNPKSPDVESFFKTLQHPHARAFKALREAILDADSRIVEGIKWKVPSFRTTEYFATFHLRTKTGFAVILHFGAKTRPGFAPKTDIADPTGLLTWLADDRAVVLFKDRKDLDARRGDFLDLIRNWIKYL